MRQAVHFSTWWCGPMVSASVLPGNGKAYIPPGRKKDGREEDVWMTRWPVGMTKEAICQLKFSQTTRKEEGETTAKLIYFRM
ncbi:hypothetical protein F5B21DRAFT_59997 [Xylaria acuta]|nr:hypothetical protein F5B21DRAFT_59997 [Xylaria acuta]